MATYQELTKKVLAVVQDNTEPDMEAFLLTLADLPEPEDSLDAALRRMLVDMAVREYFIARRPNVRKVKP